MDDLPRVVFDAGIVLQAGLRPTGPAGRVVSLLDRGLFTLSVSEEGLAEYEEVLARPSIRRKNPHLTDELVSAIITRIRTDATLLSDVPNHFQYPRDRDDEHVINLAIEAGAQYLVSRDKDLLDLMSDQIFQQHYPHLTILDPVALLHALDKELADRKIVVEQRAAAGL